MGTANTTSATPANVTLRPNLLRDPNLPGDQRSVSRWFDVSAFSAPVSEDVRHCSKTHGRKAGEPAIAAGGADGAAPERPVVRRARR